MSILPDHVKVKINNFLPVFQKWLESDEARELLKEREAKEAEFRRLLDEKNIDQLSESEIRQVISSLWAYIWWTNKEYVADKLIKSTDLATFKSELKNLLYGAAPLARRYDRFFEKVKGIGPAGITEILAFVNPSKYGIWNDNSRKALEILGLGGVLPTKKYKISGSEYEQFNEALKSLFKLVKPNKAEPNLLDMDYFLYYIAIKEIIEEEFAIEEEEEDYDFDHDEIVEKLAEIVTGWASKLEAKYR